MTDLKDKVIIVTGASAGIGKAIAKCLASVGARVVSCARNLEKLEEIAQVINKEVTGKLFPFKCDVSKEEDILGMFKFIDEKFGTLHAIVNNAAIIEQADFLTGKTELWKKVLDVNLMGVAMCSREAVKVLKKYGVVEGHIVNINSIAGHMVVNTPLVHWYTALKHALTAMTKGLRQELRNEKSRIRVSAISPGIVESEIYLRALPDNPEFSKSMFSHMQNLLPADIAQAALYILSAPPRVNISDILMTANEEVY